MRPTVKDLAKAAGVSLATVDRVLNGRKGVTEDTIERVHQAISDIGFVRNVSAATLARGRGYRFIFLLPGSGDQFVGVLKARIAETNLALAPEMVQLAAVAFDSLDPHEVARAIGEITPEEADGVAVMVPESPQARDAIQRLSERIPHVVSFVSGQTEMPEIPFVGIDDRRAGATAARLIGKFSCGRRGAVLVIGETMTLRNEIERRRGFDAVLQRDFPSLRALPSLETRRDPTRARAIIRQATAGGPEVVGIYVLSTEARLGLEAIEGSGAPVVVVHERTALTEAKLRSGGIDALIAQDPGHLVRSAIRRLRASCEGRSPIAAQEDIRIEVLLPDNL